MSDGLYLRDLRSWTTHGMNMGQRLLQLNNTYTVADNGTITLHVAQPPPNPNLVQPGPVFMYVVIHGIPSNGTKAILGNGQIGSQPILDASVLPPNILSSKNATGSASPSDNSNGGSGSGHSGKSSTGVIVAVAVGAVAVIAIGAAIAGVIIARKRRAEAARKTIIGGITRSASMGRGYRDAKDISEPSAGYDAYDTHQSASGSGDGFIPLHQYSQADLHAPSWTPSQTSLHHAGPVTGGYGGYTDAQGSTPSFDPYEEAQAQGQAQGQARGRPRYL